MRILVTVMAAGTLLACSSGNDQELERSLRAYNESLKRGEQQVQQRVAERQPEWKEEAKVEIATILLQKANRLRASLEAPNLVEDGELSLVALDHSRYMAETDHFISPNLELAGCGKAVNIAKGPIYLRVSASNVHERSPQQIAELVGRDWASKTNSSNRTNIVHPEYRRTGIGVAFSPPGTWFYITQIYCP